MSRAEYYDETKTYGEITFDPPSPDDVLDEYARLRVAIGLRVPKLEKRLAERSTLGTATAEQPDVDQTNE